ncbi:MAG: chemotaxis-specific protein-glutamate methyltransferase CheB [Spirochaetota bacterium]
MNKIKVLIIDDSRLIHVLLEKVISSHEDIIVIGNAYDGKEGVDLANSLSPDIIIMDIGMPRMDGLEAIEEIMDNKPTPIIVFSGLSKKKIDLGFKAMELGAVDMIEKPEAENLSSSTLEQYLEEKLIKSIKTFADIKLIRRRKKKIITSLKAEKKPLALKENKRNAAISNFPVIGIAASTGGPQTLKHLIEDLSARKVNAAIVIVQHIAEGFMNGFRDWLALYSSLPVILPKKGDSVEPYNIYVAPGEHHLIFDGNRRFSFLDSPPVQGIRPCADIMFSSLAETFKERAIAVVLTGMGSDGTQGLYKIKENNGYIISQDEESSLIFGMPKSAIETGLVDKILNISEISQYLEKICNDKLAELV